MIYNSNVIVFRLKYKGHFYVFNQAINAINYTAKEFK